MSTATVVNGLRRRGEPDRPRVYLDQSTMSRLIDDPNRRGLRDVLVEAVSSGRVVCPFSSEHTAESILSQELFEGLDRLYEELSMGIDFYDDEYITWAEIYAAAREFCGEPSEPEWKEAFRTDPNTSRDVLFPGGMRVVARLPHTDELVRAEVKHAKNATLAAGVYEQARSDGYSFEEQAGREFKATIVREFGWIVRPGEMRRHLDVAVQEFEATTPPADPMQPGQPFHKVQSLGMKKTLNVRLVERYPAVADRFGEFVESATLARMPMLRYPALIHAGLALTPGRKAKPGDRFDISHLTKGLSRCDIVTADSGMAQLCKDFKLVPDDVELFGTRELDQLEARLREL